MEGYDYSKLKGRIVEKCGNLGNFSGAMGWSLQTQQKKMAGKVAWTQHDISKALKVLDLAPEDIHIYFFAARV